MRILLPELVSLTHHIEDKLRLAESSRGYLQGVITDPSSSSRTRTTGVHRAAVVRHQQRQLPRVLCVPVPGRRGGVVLCGGYRQIRDARPHGYVQCDDEPGHSVDVRLDRELAGPLCHVVRSPRPGAHVLLQGKYRKIAIILSSTRSMSTHHTEKSCRLIIPKSRLAACRLIIPKNRRSTRPAERSAATRRRPSWDSTCCRPAAADARCSQPRPRRRSTGTRRQASCCQQFILTP